MPYTITGKFYVPVKMGFIIILKFCSTIRAQISTPIYIASMIFLMSSEVSAALLNLPLPDDSFVLPQIDPA